MSGCIYPEIFMVGVLWCRGSDDVHMEKCGVSSRSGGSVEFPVPSSNTSTGLTNYPRPFLQLDFHLTQPHPHPRKGKTWLQFNRHTLNNNGWVQHPTQVTTDVISVIPRTKRHSQDRSSLTPPWPSQFLKSCYKIVQHLLLPLVTMALHVRCGLD